MRRYRMKSKSVRIFLCMILSTLMMISLVGFSNITDEIEKKGVKCVFKAIIVETIADEKGQGLVVKKKPHVQSEKINAGGDKGKQSEDNNDERIYVLVTDKTKIAYTINKFKKGFLDFDDLKVGMSVMIKGIKVLKQVDGQEIVVVLAKSIEPVE